MSDVYLFVILRPSLDRLAANTDRQIRFDLSVHLLVVERRERRD